MNPDDTSCSIYTVAFRDGRFLMVYNPKRGGWEMPGGHIRVSERPEDAAKREFVEESGFGIKVVAIRDLGHCFVCAAELGDKISPNGEMEYLMFEDLPEDLAFERGEYEDTVPWARTEIYQ